MLGDKLKRIPVSRIMTENVLFVSPDSPVSEVAKIFKSHRIHHIPVLNASNEVVGVVGRREYYILLDHFTLFNTSTSEAVNERFLGSLLAREIMQKHPITITDKATLKDAYGVFRENLIHALPVVDRKNTLVGMLTTMDLLNYAFAEETQMLT